MIAKVTGMIAYRGAGFVICERDGIGYKVILPEEAAQTLSGEVTLYTHEVIREDGRELFGFLSMSALELFWKLISISGVGPRVGQKIVFAGSVDEVRGSIMGGKLAFLTDIPGIGTKTAQKIILEMKGVLAEEPVAVDPDAMEALLGFGYTRKQAEDALARADGENTEARIRSALKVLSR